MSCNSSLGPTQEHLVATSTTLQYWWPSPWELAIGAAAIKAVTKRRQTTALQTQLAIQVAAVRTDVPSAPQLLGNSASGNNEECSGVIDISSYTGGAYWVRTGLAYAATSATVGQSDVTFQANIARCGRALATQTATLSTYTTTNSYHILTGWLPTMEVALVKAAIICTALVGNLRFRLAYRTANTSPESPNAWSTAFGDEVSANGESAQPDVILPSIGGAMWVQLGLQFYLSSGSTLGEASVSVALAGRG